MRMVLKWLAGIVFALVASVAAWLALWPPELLRVGDAYAAKIVCSNVFIAGRDPAQVLAEDVQAPGHPLLKLMRQDVDLDRKTVTTHLLGVFAPGHAAWHDGFGCSSVPDGDFLAAQQAVSDVPLPRIPAADPAVAWPDGEAVTPDAAPAPPAPPATQPPASQPGGSLGIGSLRKGASHE